MVKINWDNIQNGWRTCLVWFVLAGLMCVSASVLSQGMLSGNPTVKEHQETIEELDRRIRELNEREAALRAEKEADLNVRINQKAGARTQSSAVQTPDTVGVSAAPSATVVLPAAHRKPSMPLRQPQPASASVNEQPSAVLVKGRQASALFVQPQRADGTASVLSPVSEALQKKQSSARSIQPEASASVVASSSAHKSSLQIIQGKQGQVYQLTPQPAVELDRIDRNTIIIPAGNIPLASVEKTGQDVQRALKKSASPNSDAQEKTSENPNHELLFKIGAACIGGALLFSVIGIWLWLRPVRPKLTVAAGAKTDISNSETSPEGDTNISHAVSEDVKAEGEAASNTFDAHSLDSMMAQWALKPAISEPETASVSSSVITAAEPEMNADINSISEEDVTAQVSSTLSKADCLIRDGLAVDARTIVNELLQKWPTNRALMVKMLEIHMILREMDAFHELAGRLLHLIESEQHQWDIVAKWGRSIDVMHSLYQQTENQSDAVTLVSSATERQTEYASGMDTFFKPLTMDELPATPPRQDSISSANPFAGYPLPEEDDPEMVFEKGLHAMKAEWRANLETGKGLSMATAEVSSWEKHTDDLHEETKLTTALHPESTEPILKPPFTAAKTETAGVEKQVFSTAGHSLSSDLTRLSLDLDVDEAHIRVPKQAFLMDSNSEERLKLNYRETESRLELVRAYEDMGDVIGARELLSEILKTVQNPGQRAVAEEMLRDLR